MPVDFIRIKDTGEQKLVYRTVEVMEEDAERYLEYSEIIELIFDTKNGNRDISIIRQMLRKLITQSRYDKDTLLFLMDNQWILKFALKIDVHSLLSNPNFVPSTCVIAYPYDAFISDKYRRIYLGPKQIPVWERKECEWITDVIEWLVLDETESIEEKAEVMSLSQYASTRFVLKNNPWILMLLSNQSRAKLMQTTKIPSEKIEAYVGYERENGQCYLLKDYIDVPLEISREYTNFNYDLSKMFKSKDESLDELLIDYCYHHSKEFCSQDQKNYLRQNMWVLDLVKPETRDRILHLLGLDEIRVKKKMLTFGPKNNSQLLYSKQLSINSADYEQYRELNSKLFSLFSGVAKGEPFDEEKACEFIMSDERVLTLWPWLMEYVTDPNLRLKLIENDKHKRK